MTHALMTYDESKPTMPGNLPPFAATLRQAADTVWEEGYRQPFLRELGAGTLERDRFAFYMTQDSLYLNDYAKVHALALAKTDDPQIMQFMAKVQNDVFHVETSLHRSFLASFGITPETLAQSRQSAFARAYTSNMLAIAYGGDILDVMVAVLPCAWVYADYGQRLAEEFAGTLETNPYRPWIDMYSTGSFWSGAQWLIDHIEPMAQEAGEDKRRELTDLFVDGVENEYMFWDSAYRRQMSWKPGWER